MILTLAAVLGIASGARALWRAPIFSVDHITVAGNQRVKTRDILALAAVPPDATLLRLPKSAIEDRLLTNAWVSSAVVSRRFPHTVEIDVVERVPAALVDNGGADLWLVSRDGFWLGKRTATDTSTLVTIRDVPSLSPTSGVVSYSPELRNALAVLQGISPDLRAQVRTVSAASVDKTTLILRNAVQVFIGPSDDIAKKDLIARGILAREKSLVSINVRVVDRPTWRGLGQGN